MLVQVNDSKTMRIEKYLREYMPDLYERVKLIRPEIEEELNQKPTSSNNKSNSK